MPTLPERLRQAAQYTGLDSMRELLIEAAMALEQPEEEIFKACVNSIRPRHSDGDDVAAYIKSGETILWMDNDLAKQEISVLYRAPQPPERKPLTDEQIVILRRTTDAGTHAPRASDLAFARAIEAAHGIKE